MSDCLIIGGGIIGLSVAYNFLKKYPGKSVFVLEKESNICKHQSGRNSGVIHSGIYYKPGSLKAINCRKGKKELEQFCNENEIPFQKPGKLIIATDKKEEERLQELYKRGKENEIECSLLTKEQIIKHEPNASGLSAIHIAETGIVDYKLICQCFYTKIHDMGGFVHCGEKVASIKDNVVETSRRVYEFDTLINCAGLYADTVAKLTGYETQAKIIPFRGDYYTLSGKNLVKGLIYPVPDPRFPFLGVHFTKTINDDIECGPNAVLAFGKESYNKLDLNLLELFEILTFPGFWKLSFKYWNVGLQELLRSLSKTLYTKSLQKLVPSVRKGDLLDNRPSGIRSQVVLKNGILVDDFLIEKQKNIVHVLNAPSPAATACLTIGRQIVEEL